MTITMLMEAQGYKIFGFLSGCFSCTILKGQDCLSLLFRVLFITLMSISFARSTVQSNKRNGTKNCYISA